MILNKTSAISVLDIALVLIISVKTKEFQFQITKALSLIVQEILEKALQVERQIPF